MLVYLFYLYNLLNELLSGDCYKYLPLSGTDRSISYLRALDELPDSQHSLESHLFKEDRSKYHYYLLVPLRSQYD